MPEPKTLLDAVRHFSNLDTCHEFMVALKWPDGEPTCPKCGGAQVGEIKSRRMLQCREPSCKKQFSVKLGTIFQDSAIPLSSWFVVVWCEAYSITVSSIEIGKALGVTQKTAWLMRGRVRAAMQTKAFQEAA